MALKIRLSRGGSKKRPFYRIVVAEAAAPRDGRYVERVGHYNPMVPKEHENRLSVNGERVKFWMDRGAQPTDRVHKLLSLDQDNFNSFLFTADSSTLITVVCNISK